MGQSCEQRRFALEVGQPELPEFGLLRGIEHLFDRARAIDRREPQVASLVDRAHSADAQDIEHAVAVLKHGAEFQQIWPAWNRGTSLAILVFGRVCGSRFDERRFGFSGWQWHLSQKAFPASRL